VAKILAAYPHRFVPSFGVIRFRAGGIESDAKEHGNFYEWFFFSVLFF